MDLRIADLSVDDLPGTWDILDNNPAGAGSVKVVVDPEIETILSTLEAGNSVNMWATDERSGGDASAHIVLVGKEDAVAA